MHERGIPEASFADAVAAFRAARFADAARILDGLGPAAGEAAVLLRARTHLKRAPADALAWLAKFRAALSTPAGRGEAAMLAGAAYARLGDEAAAEAKFRSATAAARESEALALELEYQRAAAAWIARKLDVARRRVASVRARATPDDVGLEAAVLDGAIAASRGDVATQGRILLEALGTARDFPGHAVHPRAVIASQIAYLARELPDDDLREAAYAEVDAVPWTKDLADFHFTMVRAVGWRHALDGDYFNAFRLLKRAGEIAPTGAWRLTASCDRAYLATMLNEPRWAEQELRDAREIADAVEWNVLRGEERFGLAILAELIAPHDAALGLAFLARYKESGKHFDRALSSADDRRVAAMEAYSGGVVARALGDGAEAVRMFEESWRIYRSFGYQWRAGRAARAAADLTGSTEWRARADEALAAYPQSWLVTALATASSDAEPEEARRLTRAQREVYDALLRGLTTSEIAAEQGRSAFTVRNHVKAILKTFGVNSRTALLARVR